MKEKVGSHPKRTFLWNLEKWVMKLLKIPFHCIVWLRKWYRNIKAFIHLNRRNFHDFICDAVILNINAHIRKLLYIIWLKKQKVNFESTFITFPVIKSFRVLHFYFDIKYVDSLYLDILCEYKSKEKNLMLSWSAKIVEISIESELFLFHS